MCFNRGSVLPRVTSVTVPKKVLCWPWMVTNAPTLMSSMEAAGSKRTSMPWLKDPSTTKPNGVLLSAPSDCNCRA